MQKNETGPLSYTIRTKKFKMGERPVRQETIRILQENTGSKLFGFSQSNFLLDTLPKARQTNVNYWDFLKIKYNAECSITITIIILSVLSHLTR